MALDTEKLLEQASQAVREAGELLLGGSMAGHIRQKGATDFVTQVDLEVQTMLQKRLAEIAPEVQFMGEEKDNSQVDLSGAVWILDPVDGTTNLIHGYCHSAVSLALAEGGEVTMASSTTPTPGNCSPPERDTEPSATDSPSTSAGLSTSVTAWWTWAPTPASGTWPTAPCLDAGHL